MSSHHQSAPMSRREMLQTCCAGFGGVALGSLLSETAVASPEKLMAHFAPRAKRMIFLFMHGGPSQHDLFDFKPALIEGDGKPLPFPKPRVQFAETGNVMKSRYAFKQYGESGAWMSELLPEIAGVVDDLCWVRSLYGSNPAHGAAIQMMHTGSDRFIRPSVGSWISYGLGTENSNLPSFISICPSYQNGGVQNYSSAFLPSAHNGVAIGETTMRTENAAIDYLKNLELDPATQRAQIDLLRRLHQGQLESNGPDRALDSRIDSFELAFRMQTEAPDTMNLDGETNITKKLYGLDEPVTNDFGMRCLLARRFSERGVRFVQATHGPHSKWDHHDGLHKGLTTSCKEVDKPVAGLIRDLKARGLLDETLVLWGGEFGRTPGVEGYGRDGRDHNPHGFTMFMAGGGVKPGFSYGVTDDFGYYAVEDRVHIHDLHATILHIMGINHERLTYKHEGRDYRLTDVHGNVIRSILA